MTSTVSPRSAIEPSESSTGDTAATRRVHRTARSHASKRRPARSVAVVTSADPTSAARRRRLPDLRFDGPEAVRRTVTADQQPPRSRSDPHRAGTPRARKPRTTSSGTSRPAHRVAASPKRAECTDLRCPPNTPSAATAAHRIDPYTVSNTVYLSIPSAGRVGIRVFGDFPTKPSRSAPSATD